MADERCYRRGDEPTDLSTDTRYVWDDDVFHGPWCRADAHQPNCIHSAYLRPGDAPDEDQQYGGNVLADLAAAQAQVAQLKGALTAALDDLEARDELSALDGLRAALAPGEPSADPRDAEIARLTADLEEALAERNVLRAYAVEHRRCAPSAEPGAEATGEPEPARKRFCDGGHGLCFATENLRAYMLPHRSAPIMACERHAPDAERIIAEHAAEPSAEPGTEA